MIYRAIGVMSGSSLDGLDIVFAELDDNGGRWSYQIKASSCYEYETKWISKLQNAYSIDAYNYLLLHAQYGAYVGHAINKFIEEHRLHHSVQLIGSHGHTVFHDPGNKMTSQLGDGAAIAALTGINTVSDLRAMDIALGGQGAPIVPMGEKLLFADYTCFINLGGIANISFNKKVNYTAFDICPANRVLNFFANKLYKPFDEDGAFAAAGKADEALLQQLNALNYYQQKPPKSLANSFGDDVVIPLIASAGIDNKDALATYTEHIAQQIAEILKSHQVPRILVTGGGAFNSFLLTRIKHYTQSAVEIIVPEPQLVMYKEALIMALLGVLRWREENTVLHSVTGASRSSIGGAVWIGQDA